MRAIVGFVGRVLASRAGQALFVIHLCLAVYAFAEKPAADPSAYGCDIGNESTTELLAGRPFHFHYESPLLKTLLILDIPSVIPAALADGPVEPMFCDYAGSWVAALILLFFSSAQWWLIGYGAGCAARACERKLP